MLEAKFKRIIQEPGRTRFTGQLYDTTAIVERVADPLTKEAVEQTRYDRKPLELVEFDIPQALDEAQIVKLVSDKLGRVAARDAKLRTVERVVTLSAIDSQKYRAV